MARPDHTAMMWQPRDDHRVQCELCGHRCLIAEGKYGLCRVRQNVGGELLTRNYDAVVALNVDPIEKKPLFHFLPGTRSLSIACAGCNFQCEFCQNWQISQQPRLDKAIVGEAAEPEQIVAGAIDHDCRSISFTYTEPTVFFELAFETAMRAHARGLKNCFVSNGYLTPPAVETIAPYLDAINVDLKAFRDETYRRVMKASLAPVLTCLEALVAAGIWVEVTTLVVPGMNDSETELRDIAAYIAGTLGLHVPWHVSRFHADYKMDQAQATPIETLELACDLGRAAGLKYIYCGNVAGHASEKTLCPSCGHVAIDRAGFRVRAISMDSGRCSRCGEIIEGVWDR